MSDLLNHLKTKYGYNNFREYQQDMIEDVLNKNNTVIMVPTGGGKSLVYQFPATFTNSTSIVISPLLALMEDQQKNLEKNGIKSICLNSNTTPDIPRLLKKKCETVSKVDGFQIYNVIYTTPEYFMNNVSFFQDLKNICLIALDEAHCLSAWGHDFRPSYKKLSVIKDLFSDIPIMLLTASATPNVLNDITETVGLEEYSEYNLGTRRTNLHVSVRRKSKIVEDLKIINPNESTIIYTNTRDECENVCKIVNRMGIPCEYYHAGLSTEERSIAHEKFIKDKIRVMVATVCYGMGIDKPDIRLVINWGAPSNLETYYQEIGRAGRDGVESKAVMFYDEKDFSTIAFLNSKTEDEHQREIKTDLMNIFKYYINNGDVCRQVLIDKYFENGYINSSLLVSIDKDICKKCDNCCVDRTKKRDTIDIIEPVKMILGLVKSLYTKYGITKLIDVLRGSKSIKINALNKSQFYGKGKKYSVECLKDIFNLLIQKGYLQSKPYKFASVIHLGEETLEDDVDKFETEIELDIKKSPVKQSVIKEITEPKEDPVIDENLIKKYDDIRKTVADENNIAPYQIIDYSILLKLCEIKPKTVEELFFIDGMSLHFIKTYGHRFILEKPIIKKKEGKYVESYELFESGMDISSICNQRKVKRETIENDITRYLTENPDKIVYEKFGITDDIKKSIQNVVDKIGKERLKPIKEAVDKKISYLQIKISLIK